MRWCYTPSQMLDRTIARLRGAVALSGARSGYLSADGGARGRPSLLTWCTGSFDRVILRVQSRP
jgi:hypothetical protein